ncbi:hypothetical protein D3C81_1906910 [compost metagenome]
MDMNDYNYYFGLLTGNSPYGNKASYVSAAREKLVSAFYEANVAAYVADAAMGAAVHISTNSFVKMKSPTVTDSEAVVPKGNGNASPKVSVVSKLSPEVEKKYLKDKELQALINS